MIFLLLLSIIAILTLIIAYYFYIRKIVIRKNTELEQLKNEITERTYILEKNRTKVNNIIDEMQEEYFECDLSGKLVKINNKMCRSLEYSNKEELIGMPLNLILESERGFEVSKLGNKEVTLRVITKETNKIKIMEGFVDYIKDDLGNVMGFRCFMRDETEKEHLIKQLENSNNILKDFSDSLIQSQSQFLFDLSLARSLQDKFLPPAPYLKEWDIGIHFQPISGVSGDFYDFYLGRNKELKGVSLFDVSGHGVSSGLLSLLSKHMIHNEFRKHLSNDIAFSDILKILDIKITKELKNSGFYLTGLLLNIDEYNNIEYVSAGHPPIIKVSKRNATRESIENNGFMLGTGLYSMYNMELNSNKIALESGDFVVLYSDCLIEEWNHEKESFENTLIKILQSVPDSSSAEEITQLIVSELYKFISTDNLTDDLTIITIKRK